MEELEEMSAELSLRDDQAREEWSEAESSTTWARREIVESWLALLSHWEENEILCFVHQVASLIAFVVSWEFLAIQILDEHLPLLRLMLLMNELGECSIIHESEVVVGIWRSERSGTGRSCRSC